MRLNDIYHALQSTGFNIMTKQALNFSRHSRRVHAFVMDTAISSVKILFPWINTHYSRVGLAKLLNNGSKSYCGSPCPRTYLQHSYNVLAFERISNQLSHQSITNGGALKSSELPAEIRLLSFHSSGKRVFRLYSYPAI